ncbi:ABC transporter ATP-binding protein [Streptomyces europaeiscabiei]|uniref:ABC transporter ATP-binding protein n=1 Tax=Streptomyces europaeiscabiei TaxID=146819 RepID=UPI0038F6A8A5
MSATVPDPARTAERPVLELIGLTCRTPDRVLFSEAELSVRAGESVAVMGASGSGKSTLLACVLGLGTPSAGEVRVDGEAVGRLSRRSLAQLRRDKVGMVFQHGELLPELSPLENVALAALLGGQPRAAAYDKAARILGELGVPADAQSTATLSGGERQRTAVARALVNDPLLLLADEPTGALDTGLRDTVADLLYALPGERGCALLIVTHHPRLAARADAVATLADGRLTVGTALSTRVGP